MPTAIPSGITSVGTESQRGVTSFADMRTGLLGSGDPSQNFLINGAFDFWQRGTDLTGTSAGAYVTDRWWLYTPSAGTSSAVSRTTYNDEYGTYGLRMTGGAAADTQCGLGSTFI